MSAFCIHAYHDQLGLEGLGIYDAIISFTLNTGTIILFSVIVATAFVLSFIYFTLARLLTKVVILLIFAKVAIHMGHWHPPLPPRFRRRNPIIHSALLTRSDCVCGFHCILSSLLLFLEKKDSICHSNLGFYTRCHPEIPFHSAR